LCGPARHVKIVPMEPRLPLSALLSQALVAFTIEFDNEADRRLAHRTTRHGSHGDSLHAPWLVSMVMWFNCMKFIGEEGISVRELVRLARTKTNFHGMLRWGYVTLERNLSARSKKESISSGILRPTIAGKRAREIWGPLVGEIERRWQQRFGEKEVANLGEALEAIAGQFQAELPDCMPILNYGLTTSDGVVALPSPSPPAGIAALRLPLVSLLARVLIAFATEFEHESELSLAISANVLRVLSEKGERLRDLPVLSGVSKESISMAMGILRKKRMVTIEPEAPGSRTKVARLTSKGLEAQGASQRLIASIENRWQDCYGEAAIGALREPLEPLVGGGTADSSPLFRGLDPHPGGWRASVPKPKTLPHYPMVLHRGGYPDGS